MISKRTNMHLEITLFSHLFLVYNNTKLFFLQILTYTNKKAFISKRNKQKFSTSSNYPQDGSAAITQNTRTRSMLSTTSFPDYTQQLSEDGILLISKALTVQQLSEQYLTCCNN